VTPDSTLQFMRLIWAVDHELQSISKRMQAHLGLTVPQRMALLLVGRKRGILASELAELLHLHPGTISGVVGRLEAAGLIVREDDAEDARRIRLALTPAGLAANRRRAGTFEAAVRRVLAASSKSELAIAGGVLTRLADELRVVTSPPASSRSSSPASTRSRRHSRP
jgi:DNA-binding MarR family transcriptional regulator